MISRSPRRSRQTMSLATNECPALTSFSRLNQNTGALVAEAIAMQGSLSAFRTAKSFALWFSKMRDLAAA